MRRLYGFEQAFADVFVEGDWRAPKGDGNKKWKTKVSKQAGKSRKRKNTSKRRRTKGTLKKQRRRSPIYHRRIAESFLRPRKKEEA